MNQAAQEADGQGGSGQEPWPGPRRLGHPAGAERWPGVGSVVGTGCFIKITVSGLRDPGSEADHRAACSVRGRMAEQPSLLPWEWVGSSLSVRRTCELLSMDSRGLPGRKGILSEGVAYAKAQSCVRPGARGCLENRVSHGKV